MQQADVECVYFLPSFINEFLRRKHILSYGKSCIVPFRIHSVGGMFVVFVPDSKRQLRVSCCRICCVASCFLRMLRSGLRLRRGVEYHVECRLGFAGVAGIFSLACASDRKDTHKCDTIWCTLCA